LDFLGISTSLQALFGSNTTSVCEGETVEFYDQSTGDVISWEWTFEGGSPGTSSFQNPTVMYFNEGTYDVTLIVSDGVENNTLLIEDYITVGTMPGIPATPTGDDEVCTNFVQFSDYTTTGATFADSYIWEILPVEAGAITGAGTTGTVEWTTNWEGTASVRVKGVNAECGEGEFSEPFEVLCEICTGMDELSGSNGIHIFPNPSNGEFTVEFSNNIGKTEITIMNMLNEIVYESKTEIVAGKLINIDLSGNSAGVYFVKIKSDKSGLLRKIIIR
ncbi:MAG: PKD domain-containing protein, partial [Bacteroidales bacterium]|nr:PKD domain-containing protein [Bacteroidales bacterium]